MSVDNTRESIVCSQERTESFWMIIAYVKMRTFFMYCKYYPKTTYESFELVWPSLLDSMLVPATEAACKKLAENKLNMN